MSFFIPTLIPVDSVSLDCDTYLVRCRQWIIDETIYILLFDVKIRDNFGTRRLLVLETSNDDSRTSDQFRSLIKVQCRLDQVSERELTVWKSRYCYLKLHFQIQKKT